MGYPHHRKIVGEVHKAEGLKNGYRANIHFHLAPALRVVTPPLQADGDLRAHPPHPREEDVGKVLVSGRVLDIGTAD